MCSPDGGSWWCLRRQYPCHSGRRIRHSPLPRMDRRFGKIRPLKYVACPASKRLSLPLFGLHTLFLPIGRRHVLPEIDVVVRLCPHLSHILITENSISGSTLVFPLIKLHSFLDSSPHPLPTSKLHQLNTNCRRYILFHAYQQNASSSPPSSPRPLHSHSRTPLPR